MIPLDEFIFCKKYKRWRILMSTEYYFYLGYRDNKTGKYGILGPYANNGEYKYILCRSQSFVSDLYESFRRLSPDDLDDSIK